MERDYTQYGTIYWAFTQICNDKCAHCYNNSGPQGKRMSDEDCLAVIANLPTQLNKLILSGGEPLADKRQLFIILHAIREKYQGKIKLALQTNGDLLKPELLDELLTQGVQHIGIASLDRFHKHAGAKLTDLKTLFDSRGMVDLMPYITVGKKAADQQMPSAEKITYSYFGANEDMWLGGNWARGRAMEEDIWMKDAEHDFCGIQSGAKNFLGGKSDVIEELTIQLWDINPCCPGTKKAMGDARIETIASVLNRVKSDPVFIALNEGEPYKMGQCHGISEEQAKQRGAELKNMCLWCDEFFDKHYTPKVPA